MCELKEILATKVSGPRHIVSNIIGIILRCMAYDVEPYIIKGLEAVDEIILALPFTRYGWFLAIYQLVGRVENSRVIVYYNSAKPRWTASYIIHELSHKGLDIKRSNLFDAIIDETLAYLASFKLGFLDLYEQGIKQYIKSAFMYKAVLNESYEYELVNTILPRILARRLINYNYSYIVNESVNNFHRLVTLWLNTEPTLEDRKALAIGFIFLNIDPLEYGLEKPNEALKETEIEKYPQVVLEGVDKEFIEMTKILEKAAENPSRLRDILAPWWNEIEPILDDLEAYITVYGTRKFRDSSSTRND